MSIKNREVRLKQRPTGMPEPSHFELVETELPEPGEGEFLARNIWMSVDPYMRGRMTGQKSYVAPFEVGHALDGGCIAKVVTSRHPQFAEGDYVLGQLGWRDYWISNGQGVAKVNPALAPLEAYLGPLGMPGLTAYIGMLRIAEVQQGETVFVSAAAGAVGSVACQIGKIKGCKVLGSAGSDQKVQWLLETAGIDAAFNYKKVGDLAKTIAEHLPEGIDVYYENVGGEHLEAALRNMRDFGRIAVCGMIAQYNEPVPPPGPRSLILIIPRRLKMQGFIVTDHMDMRPQFLHDMAQWLASGQVRWERTVVEGLEHAADAFIGLFRGENIGKMLVRLAPDDET